MDWSGKLDRGIASTGYREIDAPACLTTKRLDLYGSTVYRPSSAEHTSVGVIVTDMKIDRCALKFQLLSVWAQAVQLSVRNRRSSWAITIKLRSFVR